MAKRSPRAARPQAHATYAEAGATDRIVPVDDAHFVVFRIADGGFGFRLEDVGEIVRLPSLAHMPLAPRSLLGLANVHGMVLPVVSLRRLLNLPDAPVDETARVIVIDRGDPVGFVVDRIDNLLTLPADRIEKDDAGAGSIDPDLLDGILKGAEGDSTIGAFPLSDQRRPEFETWLASRQQSGEAAGGTK